MTIFEFMTIYMIKNNGINLKSSSFNHKINSCFFSIFSKSTESISLTIDSHDEASETGKNCELIILFDDVKYDSICDVIKVVLF